MKIDCQIIKSNFYIARYLLVVRKFNLGKYEYFLEVCEIVGAINESPVTFFLKTL